MGEVGCLKDGNFQNLQVEGNMTALTEVEIEYLSGGQGAFLNKDISSLTGTVKTITQTHGAAGEALGNFVYTTTTHVLTANAANVYDGDGSADAQVSLPNAVRGTALLLRINGDIDQANTLTIQTFAAAQVFAKQVVGVPNGATASSVITAGTEAGQAASTSNEIIYTAAAGDTNIYGIGTEFWFYCPVDGRWLVDVRAVAEGTGATGVLTVATVAA